MKTLEDYGPVVGRFLLGLVFLVAGLNKVFHFGASLAYMEQNGMNAATEFFLICAMIVEIGGAIALMLGWFTRYAALVLAVYLIPVTLVFHNFWAYSGAVQQMQLLNFLKNLAIMGGLVYVAVTGARAVSIDRRAGRERPIRQVHA